MRDYSGRTALANYDRTTIVLHWLTVAFVIALFALAESWGFLQHGTPLRKELQSLHISLGILLTVVLAMRLGWRLARGRQLPAAVTGLQELAAKAMHYALYLLLTVQVILGFLYRWAQAESFMFFGLFPIQFSTLKNSALDNIFGSYHNTVAWIIIILAGVHNSLRAQTHERIDEYLIGRDSAALLEAVRQQRTTVDSGQRIGVSDFDLRRGVPDPLVSILTCTNSNDTGDFKTAVATQVGLQV